MTFQLQLYLVEPLAARLVTHVLGGENLSLDLAEAHVVSRSSGRAAHHDRVTVLQELAGGAIVDGDGVSTSPSELQHGSEGVGRRTRDGACCRVSAHGSQWIGPYLIPANHQLSSERP